ncbi:MAG: acetyltransferase [Burkholderiales bacterium]|nr:acetyltransferase [Burkholderiales bacterium]
MQIVTPGGFLREIPNHPFSRQFQVLEFDDGAISLVPRDCFKKWDSTTPDFGICYWGRACSLGVGTTIKYDFPQQSLRLGNFIAGGQNLRFMLNGQHQINTMSTYLIDMPGYELGVRMLPDLVLENDIWIGDETMILGGARVSNGVVIGARSLVVQEQVLEPFGIYAGSPARLIRHRFDSKIIDLLQQISWWNQPLTWIKAYGECFRFDLSADVGKSVELLTELKSNLSN